MQKKLLKDEKCVNPCPQDSGEADFYLQFRDISAQEIKRLYFEDLTKDFPKDELKKLELILELKDKGSYIALAFFDREAFVGYTFIATDSSDKGLCILDYFAVKSSLRGKGYGSRILSLITAYLSEKSMLLCEVEDPFMTMDSEEKLFRQRRMDFYISNGWRDTGISVFMFDVDYRILSAQVGGSRSTSETLENYRKIYLDMLGEEEISKNMRINTIKE